MPVIVGDFDGDSSLGPADIDLLSVAVRSGVVEELFDVNTDGSVDADDRDFWVEVLASSRFGDVDLDGDVEFDDFLVLSANFGRVDGWASGDFDGSGQIEFSDFFLLSTNFGRNVVSVPEVSCWATTWILIFTGLAVVAHETRRGRQPSDTRSTIA